jgi:hypothetical protein
MEQFDGADDIELEKRRRAIHKEPRPDNWKEIIKEYKLNGLVGLQRCFPEFLKNESGEAISESCLRQRLYRYGKDLNNNKVTQRRGGNAPPYGMAIDNELYLNVMSRRNASLAINNMDMRNMLLTLLQKNNMSHLLLENGGKYVFGQSWVSRFNKRHNLSNRAPTSKPRENPVDFDNKLNTYVNILSIAVHSHSVPPDLVINCDETGINFVANSKRTIAPKGSLKVPLCGFGKDKAQITCTLACTESGQILKPQLIFAGKTVRSLPNINARKNYFYSVTQSHWQNGESYLEFLKNVITPYRLKTIRELGLPIDQWCILIHDIHYSHLTPDAREYMKTNNIAAIHIPAGCTDSLQVCDTVLNAPFKAGVRRGFQNLVGDCYDNHVNSGELPGLFKMNLNVGFLKDHISNFVAEGLSAISNEAFQITIANAFRNHARLQEARLDSRYAIAREAIPAITISDDESSGNEDYFGSSSEEDERLILRIPLRAGHNKRTNLSISTDTV